MLKNLILVFALLASQAAHAALQIQHWTLANGARVYFVENHSIPIVDLSVEFDAGMRRDPQGKSGVAALTNSLLARGLRETSVNGRTEPAVSEAQISDAFADLAAQRGGSAGNDRAGATLRVLSSQKERDEAVALFARVLAHPDFPQQFFERDRARMLANIREDLTKPEAIANKAFWRQLYGNHPYGQHETVESVQSITRADLAAFHARHYVANRAIISIIGDITRMQADAVAREVTARLPAGQALPALPEVAVTQGGEQRLPHPATQAHLMLGTPALTRGDPDFFALLVGNYVLGGGGFVSRLTREVRERRGLAYSVYSYFNPMAQPGPFQIGLQTAHQNTDEALKLVRQTVETFLRDGPSQRELQDAKSNLTGGFPLRIDNNRKILDNVAMIGFYGLPLDYLDTWVSKVEKVTLNDVRQAFSRKLGSARLSTVVVGGEAAK